MDADTSELRAFAADLTSASFRSVLALRPVVKKGAVQIKDQLRREMSASTHFKGAAPGISFDITDGGLTAEVGPTKGGPGSLANIAYFGTSRGGGTVPDPRGALEAEVPKFEQAILDAIEGLL
jgi:hypothetical protein